MCQQTLKDLLSKFWHVNISITINGHGFVSFQELNGFEEVDNQPVVNGFGDEEVNELLKITQFRAQNKLEFQLALWTSSSQILLARGKSQATFFIIQLKQLAWKLACLAGKSTCLGPLEGGFFEP